MSNRKNAFKQENPNPTQYWIQWSSKDQKFKYYNKEKEQDIFIDLPFTFVTLDQLTTVKGWDESKGTGIFSNEVKEISKEPLDVRYFEGNEQIAKGLWKDIKSEVSLKHGDYHASVYIMLLDGSLANISLRGAALASWFEFTKKTKARLSDEKVTVSSFSQGIKGAVTYYYPEFMFEGSVDDNEAKEADRCYDILESYLKEYLVQDKKETNENTYVEPDPEEMLYQEQIANAGKDNEQRLVDEFPFNGLD